MHSNGFFLSDVAGFLGGYYTFLAIMNGVAAMIMPIGAVRRELEDGRLIARRVVEPELSRTLYMVQSERRPASKGINAVSKLLRDTVRDFVARNDVGWRDITPS